MATRRAGYERREISQFRREIRTSSIRHVVCFLAAFVYGSARSGTDYISTDTVHVKFVRYYLDVSRLRHICNCRITNVLNILYVGVGMFMAPLRIKFRLRGLSDLLFIAVRPKAKELLRSSAILLLYVLYRNSLDRSSIFSKIYYDT